MSFSLTLSDVPTHVVFWQEKEKDSVLKTLTERIASLEATVASLLKKETPLLSGIEMRRGGLSPLNIAQEADTRTLFKQLIEKPSTVEPRKPLPGNMYEMAVEQVKFVDVPVVALNVSDLADEAEVEEEAEAEIEEEVEEQEEQVEEEEQEQVEEEQDAEGAEQEQAEEEEQTQQLTEFEYKGVTYFRDNENQVYQIDTDGDLDETPIGIWSEEKQKLLKYAKT